MSDLKPRITVFGSWGTLHCDGDTGQVLDYDRSCSDSETETDGYYDITKVDVERYRREYQVEGNLHIDILRIGFWYGPENKYEEPAVTDFEY